MHTLRTVRLDIANRFLAFPVDFAHTFELSFEMFPVIREIVNLHARFDVIRGRDALPSPRDLRPALGAGLGVVPNEAFVKTGELGLLASECGV